MSTFALVILALLAGACFPIRAGVNARLSAWARSPLLASVISFSVGTIALVTCTLALRVPLPPREESRSLPWWAWTGGLLGAIAVLSAILLAPRLGAASTLALIITGQMIASLALDHLGIIGYPMRPIILPRLAGAGLVVVGIALIQVSQ